jgi:hypothetical protein
MSYPLMLIFSNTISAHIRQPQRRSEPFYQRPTQRRMLWPRQTRVLTHKFKGIFAGIGQQVEILHNIRNLQIRQPMLSSAE